MNSPHDELAKHLFSQLHRAAEALTAAVGPAIALLIDWSTLKAEPTELIDQASGRRFPDLRFAVKLQELEVLIQVVFEHQSDVDPLMAVRFFCHTGAIWNSARQDQRVAMPLVLNVLLHNGPRPWAAPLELSAVIDGGHYLREKAPHLLPHLPISVEDLAALSDEEIRERPQLPEVKLALLILKHGRDGEALRALREASDLLAGTPEDVIRAVVSYVLRVDIEAGVEPLRAVLKGPLGSKGEEIAMTIGEQLIAQGEALGEALGEAKGRAKGKAEGKAQMVLRSLSKRRLRPTAAQRKLLLSCTSEAQLETWFDRSLDAGTADEVFAPPRAAKRTKPN